MITGAVIAVAIPADGGKPMILEIAAGSSPQRVSDMAMRTGKYAQVALATVFQIQGPPPAT